jgi:hypothetical protein
MPCVGHKFLEDVHEDSIQFPSQNIRFLCNRPSGPLKESGCPVVSRSFSVATIWKTKLHRPDARSSYSKFDTKLYFRRRYLGRFYQTFRQCGNTSECYPVFQNSPTLLDRLKGVIALTVRTLGQAIRTLSCFGKNCPILERQS